jgi:site-specific recombinase
LTTQLTVDSNPVETWRAIVDGLRPPRRPRLKRPGRALDNLRQWLEILRAQPDLGDKIRGSLAKLIADRHAVLLFATSGVYPDTGVLTEILRRMAHKVLPEVEETQQLKSILGGIFKSEDADWLAELPQDMWVALLRAMRTGIAIPKEGQNSPSDLEAAYSHLSRNLPESIRVVAHRIAAAGLEPEMLRLDPALERHASPFMAACDEAVALAIRCESASANNPSDSEATWAAVKDHHRHLSVLLEQCREAMVRIRRRAQRDGASFHLTFRLRRLSQNLDRLETLADLQAAANDDLAWEPKAATFLRDLVLAECRRNDLRSFWRQNTELVALRVAENAGRSGEHYITSTRRQYMAMLRAAAGGGFIVALMAVVKVFTASAGLPPLTEVLANCLNYGLGFVLVHLLHLAVATKQPAMTANAIAAALDAPRGGVQGKHDARERFDALVQVVARTVRTQIAAVIGNIAIALPTAAALASAIWWLSGIHFVSSEKAMGLLKGLHPFTSGALAYAALAGICLFLAGLIAGFYDNLCAYNRIPQRLLQLRAPARWLGRARWNGLARYVENNLGALAGNFSLGFLLGGASGLGALLGLPLDVRHVTLTSAQWGFAMTSLNDAAPWPLAVMAAVGVGLIGMINLGVSFSLALWIALKSRGITVAQGKVALIEIARGFWRHPSEFFLPPKSRAKKEAGQKDHTLVEVE